MKTRRGSRRDSVVAVVAFCLALAVVGATVVHVLTSDPVDAGTTGVAVAAADASQTATAEVNASGATAAPAPVREVMPTASARVAARPFAIGDIGAGIRGGETAGGPELALVPDAVAPDESEWGESEWGGSDVIIDATSEIDSPAGSDENELEDAIVRQPQPTARRGVAGILNDLRAQGFGSFSAVSQAGDAFIFQAQRGGRPVEVTVDAASGAIVAVR